MALACELCGQPFPTRNALFRHLLDISTKCGAYCVSEGLQSTAADRGRKVALLFGYHGCSSNSAIAAVCKAITGSSETPDGLTAASSWVARASTALAQEPGVAAIAGTSGYVFLEAEYGDFACSIALAPAYKWICLFKGWTW